MISKKTIEEILFATKIEEVVGDFISLKRQGQSFVGVCPFHNDRNPSLHVTPRLGIYKCFVCDAKGNAINFLMEHAKMTYPEALEYLAHKYSIPIEYDRAETPIEKEQRSHRESLYIVNEFAEQFFMDQLYQTEEGKILGLTYFQERGFKEATLKQFHLGYCPESWDTFTKAALAKGFKEEFLLELGLTKKGENGKLYDFYRGRVIFPIHNTVGKVIGFGGRILKKNDKIAKYFNSPENEIYQKKETLYDIYLAKKMIRQKDFVYLVEGYTDVISMFESGIENVVASSGTSLTEDQIKLISKQTKNVTVLYDGDMAGIKASLRGIDMLLKHGLNIKVCLLPDGEDPDSFAKKNRDSDLSEYLEKNATDFMLFKAKVLAQEAGNDPLSRAKMVNEMITSISAVQDNIAQAFYIKECAKMFEISESILNAELKKKVWKNLNDAHNAKVGTPAVSIPEYSPQPEIKPEEQNKSDIDLLYNAEKDILLLLLKYGLYEINVETCEEPYEFQTIRIDQYIFNELYNENIIIQNPLLNKMYNHYAEIAEILRDQDAIQRSFFLSDDNDERQFALDNIETEEPAYSPKWEKKFDLYTHFTRNSKLNLQQEVQNILLTYKMRLVEDQICFLQNEMKMSDYSEEQLMGIVKYINDLNKCKALIAKQLNRIISK